MPDKTRSSWWDTAAIREKLDIFDDSDLEAFCLNYFPVVYNKFSTGMQRDAKITLLLNYCRKTPVRRLNLLEKLSKTKALSGDKEVRMWLAKGCTHEARAAINRGDWTAITTLERLHEEFPADEKVKEALDETRKRKAWRDKKYYEARAAIDRGDWSAIVILERLCEEFPDDEEVKAAFDEAREQKAQQEDDLTRLKTRNRIPRMTWTVWGSLFLDAGIISWCGWCLLKNQPGLIAYLGTLFTFAGTLFAILFPFVKVKPKVRFDENNLRRLGTNKRWAYRVAGLTVVLIAIAFTFWPLGWIGDCCPTPTPTLTPTATPTPTPTNTPTNTPTPTPTPTDTPTPTPDCKDVYIDYLELKLNDTPTPQYPDERGNINISLQRSDVEKSENLSGRVYLDGPGAAQCKCCWWIKINESTAKEEFMGCSEDCRFLIPISETVHTIFIKPELYGHFRLCTIRIIEQEGGPP